MAKRKPKQKETDDMLPAPSPSKDRHKDNQSVRLSGGLYAALKTLADRNKRPLRWEVIIALEAHLSEAGLWPPSSN